MPQKRTVLVVEDNPILAESMAFALTTFGWRVIGPVATVSDALQSIDEGVCATAILDFELEEETSIPIAERLRESGIPFAFLTGHSAEGRIPEPFDTEACFESPPRRKP